MEGIITRYYRHALLVLGLLLFAIFPLILQPHLAEAGVPTTSAASGNQIPPHGPTTPTSTPPCQQGWSIIPTPTVTATSSRLRALSVVAADEIWAVGSTGNATAIYGRETLTMYWNGTEWQVVPSPNPSADSNDLFAVAALSSNDVWAIGGKGPGVPSESLIMHWNGGQWTTQIAGSGTLYAITAISPDDIWAVGTTLAPYGTVTIHWNGTAWSTIPSPNFGQPGFYYNYLYGLAAVSSNDLWAVGWARALKGSSTIGGTMHWNGTQWTVVPQSLTTGAFTAVAANPNGEVRAISSNLIARWNGTQWVTDHFAQGPLYGIAAGPDGDFWAVGGAGRTLTMHRDGSGWHVISSPNIGTGTNTLYGVSAAPPGRGTTDAWAVGFYRTGTNPPDNMLTMRHTDICPTATPTSTPPPPTSTLTITPTPTPQCQQGWTIIPTPTIATSSRLRAVSVIAADDVWAVGSVGNVLIGLGLQTLTMHWDGIEWSVVPSPNRSTTRNDLFGVAAVASNDVWAVGGHQDDTGHVASLLMHWDGKQWTLVNAGSGGLQAITAISADDIWAVGTSWAPYQTVTLHYNGAQWSVIPSPNFGQPGIYYNYLYGVAAVSSSDVWAVGWARQLKGGSLVIGSMHWNGTQWTVIPMPIATNFVIGVAANPEGEVRAISGNLIARWAGTQWVSDTSAPGTLYSIAAGPDGDFWAVGSSRTLTMHRDATGWHVVPSPNIGNSVNTLYGVGAARPGQGTTDAWAVGFYRAGFDPPDNMLTLRYTASCTTPTPTATPATPPILVGHVNWQSRPPQPHQLQSLPITLTLKTGTTEVNYEAQYTDEYGFFTVTVDALPNGTYNWRVDDTATALHSPNYLANSGVVNLTGAPVTNAEMGLMKTGDANDNNVVNLFDFNLLKPSFGFGCGDPQYDNRTDFTGDCAVNIADFNPLKANYGQGGAPPIRPQSDTAAK